ncbi:ABC1-domain-containing protein [Protomyces lactucae-debilis]|uniref:ABC1-domain-containing protein n=1 Tax=Protomyces lactucae-debilis TaxID=2754530 RepID=A0A1Y2FTX2_PROLT|nr:ABC1-domain-containing protein [Protomyces lactucae-debilis]ORY87017.1 ABC1-domain-containing protein [Protomyces lactucae-debilis]
MLSRGQACRIARRLQCRQLTTKQQQHPDTVFSSRIVPSPSSLRPPRPKDQPKSRVPVKTLAALLLAGVGFFAYDRTHGRCLSRTARTGVTAILLAIDYKLNFNPDNAENIMALHERAAQRMYDCIVANGGLYVKVGQTIGMQSAVLPEPYSRLFSNLFDGAPQVPWSEAAKIFEDDFGRPIEEVFAQIDHRATAAASIAQVHKAVLKSGEVVAVKVQKPEIQHQVEWDLWAYRVLLKVYERIFDIPLSFTADYTCSHLLDETDFRLEKENSKRMQRFIDSESSLAERIYTPKIYDEYCSRRIMTAEWIDGVRATDSAKIEKMGFSKSQTMRAVVDTFSAQMFKFGWLHCDPHPGNLFVRPHPRTGKFQMVVIDHGLYIKESDTFREQYCLFWKSLFLNDMTTLRTIAESWGVGAPDLLASATLLRPYRHDPSIRQTSHTVPKTEKERKEEAYAAQVAVKEKIKDFLKDQEKIPQELLFIGRNMRIVQANNQAMGSPVNRISITAKWASASLGSSASTGLASRIKNALSHARFLVTVGILDFGFWAYEMKRWVGSGFGLLRDTSGGFEDEIQRNLKLMAKEQFGIEINDQAFAG